MVTAAMELKDACSLGKKAMTNLDRILKSSSVDQAMIWHIFIKCKKKKVHGH